MFKDMRILVSLSFLVILQMLFVIPSTVQITHAQADIPMQDVGGKSNNNTEDTSTASSSGLELMTIKAQLKPHSNEFMPEGYFEIKKFGFVTTNGSEICPSNNCKYSVENGQFSPNTFSGGYTFEGRLKVTTEEDDVKKSKFYDFRVDLDKTGEEEKDGEITQTLEGTFGFGGDTFNPEIEFDITNATLLVDEKNPVLTIRGERSPF